MEVEKRLFEIYEKVKEKTHTKKDQFMLVFLETFYHKRAEAYLKTYMNRDLKNRLDKGLKKIEDDYQKSLPKYKSGDPVYLLVKDHDNRAYKIHSIHVHQNKKIGYTYLDEDNEESNYIYPEALFVRRNTGRLEVDNTSFEALISDLNAKDESWA